MVEICLAEEEHSQMVVHVSSDGSWIDRLELCIEDFLM
jgi:hypothetical protein